MKGEGLGLILLVFLLCTTSKLLLFDNAYIDDAIRDVYEGMHTKDSDQMPESDFIDGTKHYLDEFQGTGVRGASLSACGNNTDCHGLVNWFRSMDAKSSVVKGTRTSCAYSANISIQKGQKQELPR
jgi:hypothetical protein